ncbi:MAG: protein-glutamate O-methyltransferase CheR [Bacteroidales bacterium]|nr:protein-glutamate O-methyltransferase CheR [Bacteroidales bacterium]MCF8390759.1 protein-glutamate O-methyltransferase CheR [Bacteroidales bacterium]
MHQSEIKIIVNLLEKQRGFDFSGYREAMLERRIQKRINATGCKHSDEYIEFLLQNPDEFDLLIDVFTINVSRFFRNSLTWEYIRKIIIPNLLNSKIKANDSSLRFWSAGCSYGEEPYSLAIILKEILSKEDTSYNINIFATDLDKKALERASAGIYGFESLKKVPYGILKKYFTNKGDQYELDSEIKEMTNISFFDLLDKKHLVPPDSIYGGFDIVFCRNVLIYFNIDTQKIIFNKLFKSLKTNGYLVLGDSEMPDEDYKYILKRENSCCKIYRKVGG